MSEQVNKNSQKSQKYRDKRQTKRYVLDFYADDSDELALIELLEQAKADNQSIKSIVKQALTNFFEKN